MTTLSSRAKDTKIDISTNDDLNTHAREQKPLVLSWETIKTIIYIIGNVGSSVGLIMVNKAVMENFGFGYAITLTLLHFAFTSTLFLLLIMCRLIETKELPTRAILTTTISNVLSIVFMNLSLHANSVGFYQITKIVCIPTMVFIDTFLYGKTYSGRVKITLCLVVIGAGIATVTDIKLNAIGAVYGAIAVISTAMSQILISEHQKANNVSPLQMLEAMIAPQFVITFFLAVPFEILPESHNITRLLTSNMVILLLTISTVLSVAVNFFTIALIGATSAVTYQVVGHTKTCLILLVGFLLWPSVSITGLVKNTIGIVIAVLGAIAYGFYKNKEAALKNKVVQ